MSNANVQSVHELERLAAWQRINAAHADAFWVWEAHLLAAEELERQAAKLRTRLRAPGQTHDRRPLVQRQLARPVLSHRQAGSVHHAR